MDLRRELKNAIMAGDVVPYFQPIVDLRSEDVTGFELLARWNHSTKGTISPGEFIPIAEEEGWMPLLTEAILRHALRSWRELPVQATLSINISPTQLKGSELATMVKAVASEVSFPLERLTLEITESTLLENDEDALVSLFTLKEAGCRLALDDFGTGYSSLTYLRRLSFDILKIDQSFVRSMVSCREDRKIVGAVVGLGKSLGLEIVAEGIEERAQADMLLCLGCEHGQGWLYGKPSAFPTFQKTARKSPSTLSMHQSHNIVCMEALPAQSYAQLTAVYNAAPVGLGFFDCSFRFVNLNHRLAGFHCLAVDELVGRTLQEVAPARYALAAPYLLRARSGETIEGVEFELPPSATGMPVTHLASFQPALDEVGEVVGVLLAVTDISERKHIERALQESYDHYANMVELSPQIPWTMDANGSHLKLSAKWNVLTGVAIDQSTDGSWLNTVYADDRTWVSRAIRNSIKSGTPFDVEFRLKGEVDRWHWVRSRGTPRLGSDSQVLRWYGSLELIDDQRRTLDALRESHAHLQRVLDALPVGVVIAEAPSGRIVSRNPCAKNILAQDPMNFEQISDYAKRVAYYRDGRRLQSADFPLAKALEKGETTVPERIFYDMGQGNGKWIDVSGAPLFNGEGKIVGAVAALQEMKQVPLSQPRSDMSRIAAFSGRLAGFFAEVLRLPTLKYGPAGAA